MAAVLASCSSPPTPTPHLQLFGEEEGKGKEMQGKRIGRGKEGGARKRERYLDSQLLTQVGEQILIAISCFTVQPHSVVWTSSDPAPNQLQNSPQALLLDGQKKKKRYFKGTH